MPAETLEARADLLRRLRGAEGHLRAVIGMVAAGEACEPVVRQLSAVQGALRAVGLRLIDCQVRRSAETIMHSPCADERMAELDRLSRLYALVVQQPVSSKR